ncbi:4'-phosphopantetheinyl transferase superfamily protein [Nocardiopsis sp. CNT-189]|uniref:holo-ACP synthase n=1 Tax=Nocardiopsis oceanisediminis TaxID=2816862 RepID=UPI003B3594F6
MVRIGVDVLGVGELDGLLQRDWFRRYAYSGAELAEARGHGAERAREFLAGRFACKESVAKVLGSGFAGGMRPGHVSVLRGPSGAPEVRLTGPAAERAAALGLTGVQASIAHKRGLVVAVALGVAGGARPGPPLSAPGLRALTAEVALRAEARSAPPAGLGTDHDDERRATWRRSPPIGRTSGSGA